MNLTDKTHCVKTYDGIEVWINEERAERLSKAVENGKMVEIDGNYISTKNISGIYKAGFIDKADQKKNGEAFNKDAARRELAGIRREK